MNRTQTSLRWVIPGVPYRGNSLASSGYTTRHVAFCQSDCDTLARFDQEGPPEIAEKSSALPTGNRKLRGGVYQVALAPTLPSATRLSGAPGLAGIRSKQGWHSRLYSSFKSSLSLRRRQMCQSCRWLWWRFSYATTLGNLNSESCNAHNGIVLCTRGGGGGDEEGQSRQPRHTQTQLDPVKGTEKC